MMSNETTYTKHEDFDLGEELLKLARGRSRPSGKPTHTSGNQELVERFGEPFYLNADMVVTGINEAYWAGLHADEHIELYEPDERTFYRYGDNTGQYTAISEDTIKQEIARSILEASRLDNLPSLEKKKTNTTLNHVVAHLKGIIERRGAFNRDGRSVHVKNGVIVFRENGCTDLC